MRQPVSENNARQRRRFFKLLQAVRKQSQDVPAPLVEESIAQAVAERRARKRAPRKQPDSQG